MKKHIILLAILITSFTTNVSAQTTDDTDVTLEIQGGGVSIGSPTIILFPDTITEDTGKFIQLQVAGNDEEDYFWVQDLKSSSSGYYTTIEIENDLIVGTNTGKTIPRGLISAIATGSIVTLEGQERAEVEVGSQLASGWRTLSTERVLIERDQDVNGSVGKYGIQPAFRVRFPAYQRIGEYEGLVTFTLYEN